MSASERPHRLSSRNRLVLLAGAGLAALVGAGVALFRAPGDTPDPVAPAGPTEPRAPVARLRLQRLDSGLPRAGQWRHGFEVVDFDGDGHLDVVHGPARKSPSRVPQVFLGDGRGRFTQATHFRFPALPYDYGDVTVADFDGDGVQDLALAVHLVGLAVLVRRGDAFETYGPALGLATPSILGAFSSRAIQAVDWNEDGRVDLVAASDGPRPFQRGAADTRRARGVVVLLGVPGGFEPLWPVTDLPGHGDSLAIADVDPASPGLEIVAASNTIGSANVLYRTSAAGLALSGLPGLESNRVVRVVAVAPHADGMRVLVGGLAPGEGGLEGSLDCVVPGAATSTRLLAGAPQRAVSALGVGDLDADGVQDLVAGEEDGTLRLFRGEGTGFVPDGVVTPEARLAGCTPYAIVFADIDEHRGDELIVSFAGDDAACSSAGGLEVFRSDRN